MGIVLTFGVECAIMIGGIAQPRVKQLHGSAVFYCIRDAFRCSAFARQTAFFVVYTREMSDAFV